MRLTETALCVNCDELYGLSEKQCPSCTSVHRLALTVMVPPLGDRGEIDLVRTIQAIDDERFVSERCAL